MLYLIGGPPRCGKTTLSAALSKKLQIPYFSIDHIASVIPPYIASDRQDDSFPLRALRQQVNGDNDRFFETYSADEIVGIYERQAATVWPGLRNFIEYAIEDEHSLVLEGWQLLPRFLAEICSVERSSRLQIRYLYKIDVEDILAGLKANNAVNDWVLRNTKDDITFARIAQMISSFGRTIEEEAKQLRFEAVNMDRDFLSKITALSKR